MPGSGCKGDQLWAPTKVFYKGASPKKAPHEEKKGLPHGEKNP